MMVLERDDRVREDRQADGRRPEQRRIAGNEARLLEAPQPPPAGSGREPDALRQLLVGDPCVGLQLLEDAPVESVQRPVPHLYNLRGYLCAIILLTMPEIRQ